MYVQCSIKTEIKSEKVFTGSHKRILHEMSLFKPQFWMNNNNIPEITF